LCEPVDKKRMIIAIASLLIGTLCVFWGYRLLMHGIYSDDSNTVWGDRSLLIKRGAPGVIFAAFGAMMIVVPMLRYHDRNREMPAAPIPEQSEASKPASPAEPPKRKHARNNGTRQHVSPQTARPSVDSKVTPAESSPEDSNPTSPPSKAWKPGRA
jgi:hypothetical protein